MNSGIQKWRGRYMGNERKMDEIRLNFDEKQTCLGGFPYGQKIYKQQVEGKINTTKPVEIIFPAHIEMVAASFVQGFFSEPVKQLGYSGIKKYIKISSASERLTQEIWENLD